jgi:AraC-like DNA-binding protein
VEEARIVRIEEFGELEVLTASFNRYSFAVHWHPEVVIAVTEGGHATFRYRGAFHSATRDAVFVHHPGEPHSGGADGTDGWAYRCVYVPEDLFKRLTDSTSLPFFGDNVFDDPILAEMFRRFHLSLHVSCSRLRRESYLIEALAWLRSHHGERRLPASASREPLYVSRARDFLHANLAEDVSAGALARAAGLSSYHLIRVFRKEVGLTPHAYQLAIRIGRAKDLLRRGTAVAEVAVQTGFYDQAHFTKVFKSQVGVTPGRYASPGLL